MLRILGRAPPGLTSEEMWVMAQLLEMGQAPSPSTALPQWPPMIQSESEPPVWTETFCCAFKWRQPAFPRLRPLLGHPRARGGVTPTCPIPSPLSPLGGERSMGPSEHQSRPVLSGWVP